jgi:fermentation-respiration switch protein FrsA (DUF1100 family)
MPARPGLSIARLAAIVTGTLLLLYAAAGFVLFEFQRSLLYPSDKTVLDPSQLGLPQATVHELRTQDGIRLIAWSVRGTGNYLAIYFHGNGAGLAGRAGRIADLNSLGFSVLAIDYRGYGGSDGSPSEQGLQKDADAAYDYASDLGFKPGQIVLYGESLGSGVAAELASRKPVAAVILDAPFSSIADVAADRYWMFPVRLLLKDQFRSDLAMPHIQVPVLILHGTADRVVPIRYGERLSRLGGDNVSFIPVEGAGHVVFGLKPVQAKVMDWLAKTLQGPV